MPTPTGLCLITASYIQDAGGNLLASGQMNCLPVNNNGQPVSFRIGKATQGQVLSKLVTFLIVNGAITTDTLGDPAYLADTTLTTPVNVGYSITIVDTSTGLNVLGPGYTCVQPGVAGVPGSNFNFDTYVPNQPSLVAVQIGPAGPPGPPGSGGGGSGIVLLSASSVPFSLAVVGGRLQLVPTAPVLVDTVTGQQYAVGVATDSGGVSRPTFTATSGAAFPVASLSFVDSVGSVARTLVMTNGRYVIT